MDRIGVTGELSNSELGCKLNRLEEGIIGAFRGSCLMILGGWAC